MAPQPTYQTDENGNPIDPITGQPIPQAAAAPAAGGDSGSGQCPVQHLRESL